MSIHILLSITVYAHIALAPCSLLHYINKARFMVCDQENLTHCVLVEVYFYRQISSRYRGRESGRLQNYNPYNLHNLDIMSANKYVTRANTEPALLQAPNRAVVHLHDFLVRAVSQISTRVPCNFSKTRVTYIYKGVGLFCFRSFTCCLVVPSVVREFLRIAQKSEIEKKYILLTAFVTEGYIVVILL